MLQEMFSKGKKWETQGQGDLGMSKDRLVRTVGNRQDENA
jgi:hypothetical protein